MNKTGKHFEHCHPRTHSHRYPLLSAAFLLLAGSLSCTSTIAITVEQACPAHADSIIDGRQCNHTVSQMQYQAYVINSAENTSAFQAGTTLNGVYQINDHRQIAGRAYSNFGVLWAVRVDVDRNDFGSHQFVSLGKEGFQSAAFAINNNGILVGHAQNPDSSYYNTPVKWSCNKTGGDVMLSPSLAGAAMAVAVTADGIDIATGYAYNPDLGITAGFIANAGHSNSSDEPVILQEFANWPNDINDARVVVGAGLDNGFMRAFSCTDTNCQFLDQTSFYSYAYGINNNASPLIVGTMLDITAGKFTATLWEENGATSLPDLPGQLGGYAYDVSDGGDIVGSSGNQAVIWRDGQVNNLNSLLNNSIGATLINAISINRHGDILTIGNDGVAYLLVPAENITQ